MKLYNDIVTRAQGINERARENTTVSRYFATVDTSRYNPELLSSLYMDVCAKYHDGDNIDDVVSQSYKNLCVANCYRNGMLFLSDITDDNRGVADMTEEDAPEMAEIFDVDITDIQKHAYSKKTRKKAEKQRRR